MVADEPEPFQHLAEGRAGRLRPGWGGLARVRGVAHHQQQDPDRDPKVAASSAKAQPGPTAATTAPPRAGPARRNAAGRTNWSSKFASTSRSVGTISGTIAS